MTDKWTFEPVEHQNRVWIDDFCTVVGVVIGALLVGIALSSPLWIELLREYLKGMVK
jgi:hypothetical protein